MLVIKDFRRIHYFIFIFLLNLKDQCVVIKILKEHNFFDILLDKIIRYIWCTKLFIFIM